MQALGKKPVKPKQYVDLNPIESVLNIGKGVGDSFVSDLAADGINDLWGQLLGAEGEKKTQKSGELSEGQELNLKQLEEQKQQEKQEKTPDIAPAIEYHREIIHAERRIAKKEQYSLETKVEEILIELKQLIGRSKEIEAQFKEIAVEEKPVNIGKYHEAFFEWVLSAIKTARMRVEDSASWLALFASKKKKQGYWNMFKKHGTTFGLSNERVVSTQTG